MRSAFFRLGPSTLVGLAISAVALHAHATTYYVSSALGDDANDGKSKATAWAHAPGMRSATGNAAAFGPGAAAGDIFILRGCDVWTDESFPWIVAKDNGWSNNHGYYANGTSAEGVQITHDPSWYDEAACPGGWNRAVFDGCKVSSPPGAAGPTCSGNDLSVIDPAGSLHVFIGYTLDYLTIEGIELRNQYMADPGGDAAINALDQMGTYDVIRNNYFHAWIDPYCFTTGTVALGSNVITVASTECLSVGLPIEVGCYDHCAFGPVSNGPVITAINGTAVTVNANAAYDTCASAACPIQAGLDSGMFLAQDVGAPSTSIGTVAELNVIDGSDTALALADPGCTGTDPLTLGACQGSLRAFWGGDKFRNNVVRFVANGFIGGASEFSGNLVEHVRGSINPTNHTNGFENNSDPCDSGLLFFDNVMHHVRAGVPIWFAPQQGCATTYLWNNVYYDGIANSAYEAAQSLGNPGGSFVMWNNVGEAGPDGNAIFPGTGCPANFASCVIANNFFVTASTTPVSPCDANCTADHNVVLSQQQASAQGYSAAEPYAFSPPSASGATVGVGASLAGQCSQAGLASLCTDTSYAVSYDAQRHVAVSPGRAPLLRPSSGSWDVGAYQFGGVPAGGGGAGGSGSGGSGATSGAAGSDDSSGGCGCRVAGTRRGAGGSTALVLLALVAAATGRSGGSRKSWRRRSPR